MPRILTFLGLLALIFPSQAQITYSSNDYAAVGDTFLLSTAELNFLDYTPAGPAQAWNYASLVAADQRIERFNDPDGAGYQASWITNCVFQGGNPFSCPGLWNSFTNLAQPALEQNTNLVTLLPLPISDWTRHFQVDANQASEVMLGISIGAGISIPLVIEFEQPDTLLRFPLSYLDRDSSESLWGIDLGATGSNLAFFRAQTRINEVEGWGSLVTPFDSFPSTLKVKTRIFRTDSVQFGMDSALVLNTEEVWYGWYAPNVGLPVLQARGNVVAGVELITTVEYLDTLRCIAPQASFLPFPSPIFLDPSDNTAEVNFLNTSTGVDSLRWNFDDGTFSGVRTPDHTFTAGGSYQVQLVGCNTVCVPAQCDTAVVPVIVIDSTVANANFQPLRDSLCTEDSLRFLNFSTFADNFEWDFGDGNGSTLRSPRYAYDSAGIYQVQLIAFKSGGNDTAFTELYVNAEPEINLLADTVLMRGDSLTLTTSVEALAYEFEWSSDRGFSSGQLSPRISPDSSTRYFIVAENECGSGEDS
ncbi:MAG: PKD domain-containing protein, partial [Bacteroidota bacterium]